VVLLALAAAIPALFRDHYHPPALAIPVLVVVMAPLFVRRFYPLPVFAWVLVSSAAAGLWDHHVIAGFAVLIALYTVAAERTRRDALAAAAVLGVVIVGVTIMEAGSGWWYDAIFVFGLVGAALGLGLYAATRRAYLAELQERALRLEHERDQQGALAAAAERARIAREMHDIVAHHLTVMVALSDGAIAATAAAPERGIEVMRTVSATGRRALVDTRRLLGVLRKSGSEDAHDALQPVPDLAELDVLLERVRAAGLPVTLEVHGSARDAPAGVQLTVYRLVQEALTNTLKHGGPQAHASVRLRYLPGELRVDVDDDGAGASASAPVGVGGGLSGMQERVHAYDGEVHSGPGRSGGWHVSARMRLDEGDLP
jgi:signal transduction histidine kinase